MKLKFSALCLMIALMAAMLSSCETLKFTNHMLNIFGPEDKNNVNVDLDIDLGKHNHIFKEWEILKHPTCTEGGLRARYCDCGERKIEEVFATGHTPADTVIEDKVEPTYETDGSYKSVIYCLDCDEKLSETSHTIPMLKHTPAEAVTENVIEETCYREGRYDTVIYCAECGAELERTTHTVEKVEHTPANAVEENVVDSTCYSVGSKDMVVYCSVAGCNAELERSSAVIDKKTHTPAKAIEENRINPTYEKDGSYQMVVYCSVAACHEELERITHTLDMLVHHPGSAVIENEVKATCTANGSYDEVIYCLDIDCGHKELSRKTVITDTISHTSGAEVEENRVNATCYSYGRYDSVVYCTVCNTELSRTLVALQKIAHSPESVVVENKVEATCTVDGKYDEVVYCSVENCKAQISRATKISGALGHAEVIDHAIAATCTKTGLTEGKHCFVCNKVLVSQTITPIIDHIESDWIIDKEATKTEDGSKHTECTICGKTMAEEILNATGSVGLEYKLNSDNQSYSVTGTGTCTDTEIVILPTHDGLPVTSISGSAFKDKTRLVSVIIPESVETINIFAFIGCTSLINVTFDGNSRLNTIGDWAFTSCTSLANFNIPSSVKAIGRDPFSHTSITNVTIPSSVTSMFSFECNTLENITVEENNTKFKSVEGVLYSKDGKKLIQYPSGRKDTSFTIPSTVTDISNAFKNASYLKKIIIPESVQNIGSYAFAGCKSLESIEIPDGENILDVTFSECSSLVSITIPQSVTNIWRYTFRGCTSIKSINYKGTVEQWNAIYKSTDYDSGSGNYTIYCTDGTISKDGTITYY